MNSRNWRTLLADYFDGSMDSRLHELDQHLAKCEPCMAFHEDVTRPIDKARLPGRIIEYEIPPELANGWNRSSTTPRSNSPKRSGNTGIRSRGPRKKVGDLVGAATAGKLSWPRRSSWRPTAPPAKECGEYFDAFRTSDTPRPAILRRRSVPT